MYAACFSEYGGPDVLQWTSVPDLAVGPDDVLVDVHACGVNNSDIVSREGTSRWEFKLPMVLGCEFAGTIAEVGTRVTGLTIGQRVTALQQFSCGRCAQCHSWRQDLCPEFTILGTHAWGGYAEQACVPARAIIPLSDEDDFVTVAASQCVVSTAWHMTMTLAQVRPAETVLIPSASGGVGSALVQCAKIAGARVIATVGSEEKIAAVSELGADVVFCHRGVDVAERARSLGEVEGVDVVLDTVGGELFSEHLAALRPDGRLAICGAHAGERVTFDAVQLFQNGWQILGFRVATPDEFRASLGFALSGRINVPVAATFPMYDASSAHRYMAERRHVGKVVLLREQPKSRNDRPNIPPGGVQ